MAWTLPALHPLARRITLAARQGWLAVVRRTDVQKLVARPLQWLVVEHWALAE